MSGLAAVVPKLRRRPRRGHPDLAGGPLERGQSPYSDHESDQGIDRDRPIRAARAAASSEDAEDRLRLRPPAPVPASSGRIHRHRLNRGGDRHANNALYIIVINRLRYDPRSRAYAERRTQEGLSKSEIIRCLKRYVAREIYNVLVLDRSVEPAPLALASA